MPTTRSRVDCGLSLTMLSFVPTTRLRSVDLPAFGLPATVTIPARVITWEDSGRLAGDGSVITVVTRALEAWVLLLDGRRKKRGPPSDDSGPLRGAGGGLLSRALSGGVPSAL